MAVYIRPSGGYAPRGQLLWTLPPEPGRVKTRADPCHPAVAGMALELAHVVAGSTRSADPFSCTIRGERLQVERSVGGGEGRDRGMFLYSDIQPAARIDRAVGVATGWKGTDRARG